MVVTITDDAGQTDRIYSTLHGGGTSWREGLGLRWYVEYDRLRGGFRLIVNGMTQAFVQDYLEGEQIARAAAAVDPDGNLTEDQWALLLYDVRGDILPGYLRHLRPAAENNPGGF